MNFMSKLFVAGLASFFVSSAFASDQTSAADTRTENQSFANGNYSNLEKDRIFVGHWIGSNTEAATCVYNSQLIAQIHKAYEEQNGIDHSTCDGLTQEQVSSIDFSKLKTTIIYSCDLDSSACSQIK